MYIFKHFGDENKKILILIAVGSPSEGVGNKKSFEPSNVLSIIVDNNDASL